MEQDRKPRDKPTHLWSTTCTCIHVYMCTCTHVYMYTCVRVYMYTRTHVNVYNGILLSHKKERNWVICRDVDVSRDCHTE